MVTAILVDDSLKAMQFVLMILTFPNAAVAHDLTADAITLSVFLVYHSTADIAEVVTPSGKLRPLPTELNRCKLGRLSLDSLNR